MSSVSISAASGATGIGLSSVVARSAARYGASKLVVKGAMIVGETAIGVGEQAAKGDEIDLTTAAVNVVLGERIGAAAGKTARKLIATGSQDSITIRIASKLERQMKGRGWDHAAIDDTIRSPPSYR